MNYLCGCYYHILSTDHYTSYQKHYLPLLNSEVHSTILSTTSRTVLKQTFTNPSEKENIKECVYTFPLYDGVSVVSFTCRIGTKILTGLVKEKVKAKEIFDQAVARGETAGYLEQAPESSDVFSTKLGNIPAGESVIVEITYIGELKHHENDGVRFTIPTKIAPRYGAGPSHGFSGSGNCRTIGGNNGEIKIVIDIDMPEDSFIKGVQSPSHPIAVSMGTVSTATQNQPTMSKASATLSLGSAALDQDFVLIVQCKDVGIPKAILETHPTIPNHRALMATLVPKFSLPPSRSEIVFVADRSGSMQGNIQMLISAMKVFLKSLPASVKFNICSFGTKHTFLWEKSQSSSRESLEQAMGHIAIFGANMGGTETFGAIKSTVERRLTDIPLEIILLTDGDIHRQNELFQYVNEQVDKTKGKIRVFPLGIGNGVSHSLIEGLARAGNGFAQAVQQGERLDNAVVRMLRGALTPHITDYTLEVKYEAEIDDDFELIDRVTEGLKVLLTPDTMSLKSPPPSSPKATISLFDTAQEPEKDALKEIQDAKFILPAVPFPKLLQAPHKIPSLFAFSRTSVYLLMSPETFQRKPIAVILRGTSEAGPLALEIPIETLATPAETIHQLAAKKAVQDLEEGRGWIYDAKDQDGVLVKDRYPSSFDDMVQREAVRLGEKFQIAGKWCSFVAVEANDKEIAEKKRRFEEVDDLSIEDAADSFEDLGNDQYSSQPFSDAGSQRLAAKNARSSASHAPRRQLASMAARKSMPLSTRATSRSPSPPSGFSQSARFVISNPDDFAPPPSYTASSLGMFGHRSVDPNSSPFGGAQFDSAPPESKSLAFDRLSSLPAEGVRRTRGSGSQQAPPDIGRGPSNLFGGIMASHSQAAPGSAPPPPPQQGGLFGTQQQQVGGLFGTPQQQQQQHAIFTKGVARARSAVQPPNDQILGNISQPTPAPSKPYLHQSRHNHATRRPRNPDGSFVKEDSTTTSALASTPQSMSIGSSARGGRGGARGGGGSRPIDPSTRAEILLSMADSRYDSTNAGARARFRERVPLKKMARVSGNSANNNIDEDEDEEDDMEIDSTPPAINWSTKSLSEKVLALIDLQDFEGFWPVEKREEAEAIVGVKLAEEDKLWLTMLVVKYLEEKCVEEEGTWSLVVEKARGWILGLGMGESDLKRIESVVEGLVKA